MIRWRHDSDMLARLCGDMTPNRLREPAANASSHEHLL